MKEKILTAVWSASLFVISALTVVTAGANILNIALPDLAVRAIGAVQLLSVVTLGYSTVKKYVGKLGQNET